MRAFGCLILIVILVLGIVFIVKPHFPTFGHAATNSTAHRLKFAVITNGQGDDPFWSAIKHGIDQETARMGVTSTYQAPAIVSVSAMSYLIDKALASKPDGLIVSIPDCNGLTPAIKRALLVGVPVISINSGSDCASKLGLLNHVGQTAYQLGQESGQKLFDAGAKHVLCINQEVGNSDFDDRCRGINDALTQVGRKSEVLAVDLNNSDVAQQIQDKLAKDSSIDAVMTLSPVTASLAITALQQAGRLSQVMLATFDLSPDILQEIRQGSILFAVDRKPDLQGVLPITILTQYKKKTHNTTDVTTADASFVTKDNVAYTSPYIG